MVVSLKPLVPKKIANWIKNFLTERKFRVCIKDKQSDDKSILTGVPQGAILSPILFLIFSYDIPTKLDRYFNQFSLSFTDELFHKNADNNLKRLNLSTQNYLNELKIG